MYGSTATVISTEFGKKNQKVDAIRVYRNWTFEINQTTASSWHQISKSSWLYIFTSILIFQLLWNICDCFFHRAAWVIIRALLVRRVYNRVYGRFPPHFYLNHKSFISCKSFKASVRPKSFNYINSYPTTNPTHPPWLITKPSWFIRSTSCGYEPKYFVWLLHVVNSLTANVVWAGTKNSRPVGFLR